MQVIFTHFKLWVAVARHNFEWVKNLYFKKLYYVALNTKESSISNWYSMIIAKIIKQW